MKIICIGRNYAEHAAELHEQLNDSGKLPEEPMFFLKPDTAEMLFTVDRIIATVSRYMTLRMGDLLYTGTPAGVGPVRPGDTLRAALEGRELLNFDIR